MHVYGKHLWRNIQNIFTLSQQVYQKYVSLSTFYEWSLKILLALILWKKAFNYCDSSLDFFSSQEKGLEWSLTIMLLNQNACAVLLSSLIFCLKAGSPLKIFVTFGFAKNLIFSFAFYLEKKLLLYWFYSKEATHKICLIMEVIQVRCHLIKCVKLKLI